ncbi:MAG: BTAD domain-containing putative transcriptional regulator [Leucobacter sp.]
MTTEQLAAAVWPERPPTRFHQSLQNQVSRLRNTWGEHIVRTASRGYTLGWATDAELLLISTRQIEIQVANREYSAACDAADSALLHWRGDPYSDIDHLAEVAAARLPLIAAHRGIEDLRLEAAIALGRSVWAVVEAERLLLQDPLDERRQGLRIRALLVAGRRGEALAAAARARRLFRDEFGVEPGPWLTEAESMALGFLNPNPETLTVVGGSSGSPRMERDDELRDALAELPPSEAIAAGREVAAAANQDGEHAEAVLWLLRCLAIPGLSDHEQLSLRIRLGDAQRLAGDSAHLGTLLDAAGEALESGGEDLIAEACFALLQLGATSTSGRPLPEVEHILDLALTRLQDAELRAPVLAAASLASSLIGDASRSRALMLEACSLIVPDHTRARILPFSYMAFGSPTDLDVRKTAADELTRLVERSGDPVAGFEAQQLRFSIALQDADGALARQAAASMSRLSSRVGDVGRRWALLFVRAAVAHLDGDDDTCERISGQAARLFAPVSPARAAAAHLGQLIALRFTQGRLGELAPELTGMVTAQPGIPALHGACALALVGTDPAAAATHARLALDRAQEDATWLAGQVTGARAAAILGDEPLCRSYLERLTPWTGRGVWQGTCSYGPVDTALALLHRARGDTAAGAHHIREAQRVASSLGAVPFLAEIHALDLV